MIKQAAMRTQRCWLFGLNRHIVQSAIGGDGLPERLTDCFVALRVAGLLQKREPVVQLLLAQRRIFLNKNQAVFGFAQLLGFD